MNNRLDLRRCHKYIRLDFYWYRRHVRLHIGNKLLDESNSNPTQTIRRHKAVSDDSITLMSRRLDRLGSRNQVLVTDLLKFRRKVWIETRLKLRDPS